MLIFQLLILVLLLEVIPFYVGGIFSVVESGRGRRMFRWISGQFLVWLGIELIAVVLIIRHESLNKAMVLFWGYIVALICFTLGTQICQWARGKKTPAESQPRSKRNPVMSKVLWCVFALLLLFQIVLIVWDYYGGAMSNEMTPYYVTSPFSMWVAFLAGSSGMQPEIVEKVVLPIAFLCMFYGVFFLLGVKLLRKRREFLPLVLVLLSVLAIFVRVVWRHI